MKNFGASASLWLIKYSAFKDSGVEWLGEIPDNWDVTILKRVCRFAYGDALAAEGRIDGLFSVFGSNGIVGSHDTANTLGPCLILGRKGSFGKVTYSDNPAFAIDTTYFIDKRQTGANLRWLYYLLQWLQLDAFSKDSAVPGLAREDAYDRLVPVCDRGVQDLIASFLDRKIAEIDALIAKKRRMIELLQEKRTAVIRHAVTKGLDPKAPMKDSGVEWLGKVPKHWEVLKLKRLSKRIQTGSTPPTLESRYYEGGTVPWYGPGSFTQNLVLTEPVKYIAEEAIKDGVARLFSAGSTLIVTIGATIGKVGYLDAPASSNQQITAVTVDARQCNSKFIAYQIKSLEPILRGIAQSATLPIMDQEEVGILHIALPPMNEQKAIIAFIDSETQKIDSLIIKILEAIGKLLEYRTALISAAVTGKIDVRNEVRA